jgi:hypothetical protein
MREEFDDIYQHIMDSYEDHQSSSQHQRKAYIETKKSVSVLVHQNVNHFNRLGLHIRSDAVHFLIINLHQLIALPLELNYDFNKKVRQQLHSDAEFILKEALRISEMKSKNRNSQSIKAGFRKRYEGLTITGGDVLKAVGNIYDELNLSKVKLWGG